MKHLIYILILAVLILCGCAEDDSLPQATLDCIETYSVENGYDFEPITFSDTPAIEPEGLTPDEAQANCEAKGYENCNASEFITSTAAKCIAQAEGLDTSDGKFQIYLELRFESVVWFALSQVIPDDGSPGTAFYLWIQATSGLVLGKHEAPFAW